MHPGRTRAVGAAVLGLCAAAPLAAQAAVQRPERAGASGTYHLIRESRLEVKTGKSGFFSFAGHEHLIRAAAFEGEIRFDRADPAASAVHIRIPTDSLVVLTPPDTAEIRKVTASMRGEVLEVARFPEILFASRTIAPTSEGYRIAAEITMHGQTREVPVTVDVEFRGDTLEAKSRFTLKQTDFGIKPYRGGPAGSVRVADEVEFRIDAIAVRDSGSSGRSPG